MIIDCHTHLFPPEFAAERATLARADRYFERLYANPKRLLAGAAELAESMKRAGVDRSVAFGFPWADEGRRRAANDYVFDAAEKSGGRLIPFAVIDPRDASGAEAEIERLASRGLKGLGEIVPDAQGFRLDDVETLRPVMEAARSRGLVVMVHASEPVGHEYPGKGTATPDALVRAAEAFPEVKLIASHWGGGAIFYEMMPEVAEALRNVYYDSAATSYLYDDRVFRVAATLAPKKILFGTDFPLLAPHALLKRSRSALADSPALADFLGDSASRLFGG